MNATCEAEIDVRAGALHTDTMTLRIQPSIAARERTEPGTGRE